MRMRKRFFSHGFKKAILKTLSNIHQGFLVVGLYQSKGIHQLNCQLSTFEKCLHNLKYLQQLLLMISTHYTKAVSMTMTIELI